jgi:hypothetical protein
LGGYPVVGLYKYLGLLVNGRLDLRDHLAQINRKAGFIAHRLYGLRSIDNLRLNINLFTTFVMPHYRLAFTLYARQSETSATKIDAHMRVWCKKFARIPINTAGHTFNLIAGDLKAHVKACHKKTKRKLEQRQNRAEEGRVDEAARGPGIASDQVAGAEEETEPRKGLRYLPRNLSPTLRAIYGSRCREHGMICVTTTHLREAHRVDINIPSLLR